MIRELLKSRYVCLENDFVICMIYSIFVDIDVIYKDPLTEHSYSIWRCLYIDHLNHFEPRKKKRKQKKKNEIKKIIKMKKKSKVTKLNWCQIF